MTDSITRSARMTRRSWALALVALAAALMPGTADAHHHSLQGYGINGYMIQGGFYVSAVYVNSEAQDDGLVAGDLILQGNGDPIGNGDDILEDINNARAGYGPAIFLVRKGRTGRIVQVTVNGR